MDVVVFGSAIVDFISYVPRLPKPGETLHGTKFATGFGGKGANQCVAAAKLGAKTAMIAKLGDDATGLDYLNNFKTQNVNVDYVEVLQGETTGIAQINVAENGDNQIVIVAGANNALSTQDVELSQSEFADAKILVCQLETPIPATIAALKAFKGISILNAAPALENTPPELLQYSTILCVNELEAALMTKKPVKTIEEGIQAIQDLIGMGANTVIITLGAQGAVYGKNGSSAFIHVEVSQKVEKVLDTTGAGDAFIGSLAALLARHRGKPLHQLIGAACKVASISVQRLGTQSSFPTGEEADINNFEKDFLWSIRGPFNPDTDYNFSP